MHLIFIVDIYRQMKQLVRDGWKDDHQLNQKVIDMVDPSRIEENLRYI